MSKNNLFFDVAFVKIIKTEGGYVNHHADHGGPTNYGITQETLSEYLGHPATIDEVKDLTLGTAKAIYKANYWDRLSLSEVDNLNLCLAFFDQAVNRGARRVAEQIQKLVNVKMDSVIGPVTIKAINAENPKKLLLNFVKDIQKSYIRIVKNDPSQIVFLEGWMNRTHALLDLA